MSDLGYRIADAIPFPGAPRFFMRLWEPNPNPPPWVIQTTDQPILIYGYSYRSTYEEDWPVEDEAFRQGMFPAICFSEEFPDPEYGFVPLDAAVQVTEQELRIVAARWKVSV